MKKGRQLPLWPSGTRHNGARAKPTAGSSKTAIPPKGHTIKVSGFDVHFPHPSMYPAQSVLCHNLLSGLEISKSERSCILLESPTGTGKTLALLTASLAWSNHIAQSGGLVYLDRHLPVNEDMAIIPQEPTPPPPESINSHLPPSKLSEDYTKFLLENWEDEGEDVFVVPPPQMPHLLQNQTPTSSLPQELNDTDQRPSRKRHIDIDEEQAPDAKRPYLEAESPDSPSNATANVTQTQRTLVDDWLETQAREEKNQKLAPAVPVPNAPDPPKKHVPVVFYATRTHSQVKKAVSELYKTPYRPRMSVLASRDNYCVNPQVKSAPSIVRDTQCRAHVKSKTCAPYINKDELLKARELSENLRVWDVEEMVELSASYMNGCPYFVAKELAKTAEIVFCPYNYLIDLSITGSIQHILKDSVVIIDEAHNVESICREEASMKITTKTLSSHLDNLDRVFRTAKKFERHRLAQIAAKARESKKKLEENASSLNPQPEYASQALQAKQSENAPTEPVLPQLARLSSFSPFSISRHSSSSSNQSASSNDPLRSSQVPGAPSRNSSATTSTAPPMTQEIFVIDSDDDDLEGDLLSDAFVDDEMLESGPPPEFFQMIDFLTPVKQVLEHLLVWMKKVGDKQLTPVPDSHEEKFSRVWNDSSLFEMLEFCTVTPLNAEHIQLSFQKASGSSETLKPKWQMIPSAVWADVARIVRVFSFALNNDREYLHDYSFILTRYRDKFFEMQLELHMLCLNPAILFRVLLRTARSVSLVSGTLAPFSSLRAELGIEAVIEARNIIQATTPHIIDPKSSQLMALRLNTFPDGAKMRWEYNTTQNYANQDALGEMLIQILAAIPDGVLLFFSSYSNLDRFVSRWRTNQIWERLIRIKAVTLEPQEGKLEFKQAWMTYSNNVDSGKGALFLGVCRGKISEGMDFQDQYARAVIVVGIPFAAVKEDTVVQKKRWNTDMMGRQISQRAQKIKAEATASEPELQVPSILNYSPSMVHQSLVVSHGPMEAPLARPDMRHESSYLHGQVWYVLQAFRAINQAVGRCIRHIKDYGAIIFFDERYCEKNNEEHLSSWVRQACLPSSNLQESIQKLRNFYANNHELDPPMRPGFRPSNAPPVSPFISKSSTHSSSRSPSPTRNPQAPPILPPALPPAPQEPATYHRSIHSPRSAAPLIRATSQPARVPILWDRDPPAPSHSKSDPLELPSAADSSHLVDSNGQSPFSRSKHSRHNGSQSLRR